MLRSFYYNPSFSQIAEVLLRFGLDLTNKENSAIIVKFEVITPDSFMWRLLIGDAIYYLYAEDFISGLDYVKNVFKAYLGNNDWSLVKVSNKRKFEDSSPVKGATTYTKPDDSDEMMKYAVDSGLDFVFLAKSKEDADEAQFSDYAPMGFDRGLVQ